MAYATTSVAVEKSQGDIRKLLQKYGAQRFGFTQGLAEDGRRWVQFEFIHAADGSPHLIRVAVPLKLSDDTEIRRKAQRSRTKSIIQITNESYEQEERRIWRVIYYLTKSRMEAVEEEVETFEQAWLPHIVDPLSGATVWDRLKPAVEAGEMAIGGAGLPALQSSYADQGDVR